MSPVPAPEPVNPEGSWVVLTQAEYDGLTPDPNTLYIIVG